MGQMVCCFVTGSGELGQNKDEMYRVRCFSPVWLGSADKIYFGGRTQFRLEFSNDYYENESITHLDGGLCVGPDDGGRTHVVGG
jgi:hypothetical protein